MVYPRSALESLLVRVACPVAAVMPIKGRDCSITFVAHWSSQKLLSGAVTQLRKATVSFMSVRLTSWIILAPTGQISMKFGIGGFFEKSIENIQVSLKSDNYNWRLIQRTMYIYDISLNST